MDEDHNRRVNLHLDHMHNETFKTLFALVSYQRPLPEETKPTHSMFQGVWDCLGFIMSGLNVIEEVKLALTSSKMMAYYKERWGLLTRRLEITWGMSEEAVQVWKRHLGENNQGMLDIRRFILMEVVRDTAESEWCLRPLDDEEQWERTKHMAAKRKPWNPKKRKLVRG